MVSPTDGQVVDSTGTNVQFDGYVNSARSSVQVQALNFAAKRFDNVGTPFLSSSTPVTVSGATGYEWSGPLRLNSSYWQAGPAGGSCAVVSARNLQTSLYTLDGLWRQCLSASDPASCASSHIAPNSPRAHLYTRDWATLLVGNTELSAANIKMTLANYAHLNAFCKPGAPENCPPDTEGVATNTYQFYEPNASKVSVNGQVFSFSFPAWRAAPWTGYVSMTSSSMNLRVEGAWLVMNIAFGLTRDLFLPLDYYITYKQHVWENCINNISCGSSGYFGFSFTNPRAQIRLLLAAENGKVGYSDAVATFNSDSASPPAVDAASHITETLNDALLHEPTVRAAFSGLLTNVFHDAAPASKMFSVDALSTDGSRFRVRPSCCVPSAEVADGRDNDCDGQIDEGFKNACGLSGALPADDSCDGADSDCNGTIDDGCQAEYYQKLIDSYLGAAQDYRNSHLPPIPVPMP